jgi:glycosyltransferase involved in cell wall biosynthesis
LSKEKLRDKHGLPLDAFIVGSFQRDGEGNSTPGMDGVNPKLEKGPDRFVDAVIKLKETHPNIHVLLTAWRRQYVIKRLNDAKIPFSYFELPSKEKLNDLYQSLDLYIVSSRCEGGPAALIECSLLGVPVISTPVGISEQVLPSSAINDDVTLAIPAVPNVDHMKVPHGYEPYRRLIESL